MKDSSTVRIALRSVCPRSVRILKRTRKNIEAMCTDLNAMHADKIALKSVHTISARILKRIRTYLIVMRADWTVEEPFRFKFEFDWLYILLIKGKMGILKF